MRPCQTLWVQQATTQYLALPCLASESQGMWEGRAINCSEWAVGWVAEKRPRQALEGWGLSPLGATTEGPGAALFLTCQWPPSSVSSHVGTTRQDPITWALPPHFTHPRHLPSPHLQHGTRGEGSTMPSGTLTSPWGERGTPLCPGSWGHLAFDGAGVFKCSWVWLQPFQPGVRGHAPIPGQVLTSATRKTCE